jgi:uncharacterized protein DUF6789
MTSFKKAFFAGLAGTVVMTVFSFISHYLQLPKMDWHEMLASFFHMSAAFGWVLYFVVGIVLAYLYGAFFRSVLPAHSWGRGTIYAIILWAIMGMVLMPVFGMGFFYGSLMMAVATFIGMALYGATVGYLYEH